MGTHGTHLVCYFFVDPGHQGDFTGCMRSCVLAVLAGWFAAAGCAHEKARSPGFSALPGEPVSQMTNNPGGPASIPKIVVTPDKGLVGKIVRVNAADRFVVVNLPPGRVPAVGQSLMVYRRGTKTGELRVTGPQMDDNVVADIVSGEAQAGDEARDQ